MLNSIGLKESELGFVQIIKVDTCTKKRLYAQQETLKEALLLRPNSALSICIFKVMQQVHLLHSSENPLRRYLGSLLRNAQIGHRPARHQQREM